MEGEKNIRNHTKGVHRRGHYVRVDTDPSMAIIGDNVNLDTRGGLSGILRARLFFSRLAVGRDL